MDEEHVLKKALVRYQIISPYLVPQTHLAGRSTS